MDIDSRYRFATNINYVPKIKLQGHGTTEKELGPYANEIVKNMSAALRKKQQKIEGRHLQGEPFVRWAPYEDIAAPPGPWWLPIPQSEFRKWGATSIEEAILGAKKAVGQITDHEGKKLVFLLNGQKTTVKVAAGYHDPADTTSIYFPMFEPTIPGGWGAYLKKRSDVPGHRPHLILKRVAADASIVPGIFKKGFPDLIRVVRPKVDR
jgi:hypothetical protein